MKRKIPIKKKTVKRIPIKPKDKSTKPTLAVLVLDTTGSMKSCIDETISGYNIYVNELRKNPKMKMTLVQFDSTRIATVQSAVPIKDAIELTKDNYIPGAMTPLYDAVGKTIEDTKKKCDGYDVLFVTLTDGLENASEKWDYERIQEAIKKAEKEGWVFAHIGVGTGGWAAGNQLYAGTRSLNNVIKTTGQQVNTTLRRAGAQAVHYASATPTMKASIKADFFAGKKEEDADES